MRQRRRLLSGLVGLAGSAVLPRGEAYPERSRLRVGVVGAGIIGAAIALELAEQGAAVTLLDARGPAAGATRNSYAWLNACVADAHYRDCRLASLDRWHRWDGQYRLGIVWGGYLQWSAEGTYRSAVEDTLRWLADSTAPGRRLAAAEVHALAPHLRTGEVDTAVLVPTDGHLDPVAVTARLIAMGRRRGVDFRHPERVRELEFRSGRLEGLVTNRGRIRLDRLVIAAGTATPSIAAMAGARFALRHAPGILVHTRPLPPFSHLLHEGPGESSFRQFPDGRVVAYDAPRPPPLAIHAGILAAPMDFPSTAVRQEHGLRMLSRVARHCPHLEKAEFSQLTLGFRPMPLDDRPIVGALRESPDVHVAVTHSGVTLAPLMAAWVADEILLNQRLPELANYRPERFG